MDFVLFSFILIVAFGAVQGNNLNFDLRFSPISTKELCNRQWMFFQDNLDRNVLWARKMRDAWGNIPSGIFSGNVYDFGSFDQCLNFEHYNEVSGEIIGQHCTLLIPFDRDDPTTMSRMTVPSLA